jgi:hypothetical protein
VARVARGHHVLGVEHLLRQLGHGQRAVGHVAARRPTSGEKERFRSVQTFLPQPEQLKRYTIDRTMHTEIFP